VRTAVPGGTERTIKPVVISQEKCTRIIFKNRTKNEDKYWTELYKYVKRRENNSEYIAAIKNGN
jgi:hypothetical protein